MVSSSTLGNCSEVDIMKNLKIGFSRCAFTDGHLIPCKYHHNRSTSIIFTTTDKGGCKPVSINENTFMSPLVKSPEMTRMIRQLSEGVGLAGSWWMVKEQREWLQRHLVSVFKKKNGEPCNILVSGVAGYAHFYSYLHIVFDAAKEAGHDIADISVDVIDSCITPILEIANIEKDIRGSRKTLLGTVIKDKYDILGYNLNIPLVNRKFINSMLTDIRNCSIRSMHCDVTHVGEYCKERIRRYDIITEHFLLSMVENETKIVEGIRRSYAQMMNFGGHLLVAGGFSSQEMMATILRIHDNHGFSPDGDDNVKVWDPYGLSLTRLQDILNNDNITHQVPLDNYLIDFVFVRRDV